MIAASMKRASYLAELEMYYCYSLHAKTFTVSHGTPFYILMSDYIEQFHDKHDVLADLAPCLRLLTAKEDVDEMLAKTSNKLE